MFSIVVTLLLIVTLKVVIESQPLAAPPMRVTLKELEAKNQEPATKAESQAVIVTVEVPPFNKLVFVVTTESHPAVLVSVTDELPTEAALQVV